MAVSLEAREPLLDHRLLEFAASLPPAMRVRRGTGKWLMKRALRKYLPKEILYRPKMGFVTPISAWFRGPLADQAIHVARSSTLAETGWFDLSTVGSMISEHRSGRFDHGRALWQMVMLDRSLSRLFNTKPSHPITFDIGTEMRNVPIKDVVRFCIDSIFIATFQRDLRRTACKSL